MQTRMQTMFHTMKRKAQQVLVDIHQPTAETTVAVNCLALTVIIQPRRRILRTIHLLIRQ
jgi:hypothetical protein